MNKFICNQYQIFRESNQDFIFVPNRPALLPPGGSRSGSSLLCLTMDRLQYPPRRAGAVNLSQNWIKLEFWLWRWKWLAVLPRPSTCCCSLSSLATAADTTKLKVAKRYMLAWTSWVSEAVWPCRRQTAGISQQFQAEHWSRWWQSLGGSMSKSSFMKRAIWWWEWWAGHRDVLTRNHRVPSVPVWEPTVRSLWEEQQTWGSKAVQTPPALEGPVLCKNQQWFNHTDFSLAGQLLFQKLTC